MIIIWVLPSLMIKHDDFCKDLCIVGKHGPLVVQPLVWKTWPIPG